MWASKATIGMYVQYIHTYIQDAYFYALWMDDTPDGECFL